MAVPEVVFVFWWSEKRMKIKIIRHVPTIPSPEVGKEYEVIRVNKRPQRQGENVYFVNCEGEEIGVLAHEMEVIKE